MTTTLSVLHDGPDLGLDVHHVFDSGEVFDHPTRSYSAPPGAPFSVCIHSRLALVIQRPGLEWPGLTLVNQGTLMLEIHEYVLPDGGMGDLVETNFARIAPGMCYGTPTGDVLIIREGGL